MVAEKEAAEESNKHEGEKASTEAEEKGPDAGKVGEDEVIEEMEQENEEAGENKEIKGEEEVEEEKAEGKSGEKEEEDGDEKEEGKTVKKSVAMGSKKEKTSKTGELLSPRTSGSDRPTRERKTVERFTVNATARGSAAKPLAIEKGQGTRLKDIPNVAFKLSKRKADQNLHLLHTILFGKKAKVHNLKKNIGLFSGFVWVENEVKQKAKVKEKLDKCVKEQLLDFCDVLNIPVNKASVKKEELSAKLLEFLESPQATTDILLADKEKGKRRKRKSNDPSSKSHGSSNVAGGKSKKQLDSDSGKRKYPTDEEDDDKNKSSQSEDNLDDDNKVPMFQVETFKQLDSDSGKRKYPTHEEDDDKNESSQSEDNLDDDNKVPLAESDEKENDAEEETDEDQGLPKAEIAFKMVPSKGSSKKNTGGIDEKSGGKSTPVKASNAPCKSTKNPSSSISKKGAADRESKNKKKTPSVKKTKVEKESETETSASAKLKASSKSSTKVLKKDQGEGRSSKKATKEPSKEEIHAVVVDILKEVDFSTATLSDILRQLGKHFGTDLLHRKSEVKDIITDVINDMSDDEDEEASESGDESGKDGGDDEA